MESAPTLETVYQALQALYQNPDVAGKETASSWLGELQRSVFAWTIADQLLQLNQDVESCYFAAQTMRTKIQYAFHELPQDSHESLRDSLLNHVSKISSDTPPVIATQLCLALADLSLQMPAWKTAIPDLIQRFSSDVKHLHFLVEILTVIPEEINSRSLRLGDNRRKETIDELVQTSPVLIQLLLACLERCSDDLRLHAKVFRCLGSWFSVSAIPQEQIVTTKLLTAPFTALANPECPSFLHESASDCVCSALYSAEIRGEADMSAKSQLAVGLFQGAMMLPDAYHMSVAMEDIDKSINYCRIFTEMAESFLDIIIMTPNNGFGDFRTLELLLTCIGHHQYEVADITFNFWYRLSEHLYHLDNEQLNVVFRPYINRLIVALCRHCQYDPDHEGIPDSGDEFADFRTRVSELIKDVVFIVGSSACFTQMFENLKNQSSESSWDASEASLFVMTAVAKNIIPEENEIVPQVLQAVLNLPDSTHIALRYTGTQLIGELSEWIEKHADILDAVLQFLLAGLQHELLATAAAKSLHNICSQCQSHMTNHFTGLVQIAQAIDSFSVSSDAALGLLKGTAVVLAKLPHDKVLEGSQQLCALQLEPLKMLVDQSNELKPKIGTPSDPTMWLDRLAAIFRNMAISVPKGQPHPCQPVVENVWPVLSRACDKYQGDVRIIERCCRCIRFAVRCIGKGSKVLLTPLVTQIVGLYQVHPHSCFLYLGSILVDEYGDESDCVPGLLSMLEAFCTPAFRLLEEQNGLREHPDTVDDLFRLCLRFVQRAALPFLQSAMVKPIICCSIASCKLDHRDANASVTKFLNEICRAAVEKEDRADFEARSSLARALLEENGQSIVKELIQACLHSLPPHMVPDSSEVLYELMSVDRPSVCRWLETALKDLPHDNAGGAMTATMKQLTDFHRLVTSAEDRKTVTRATRDLARLYR